MQIAIFGGSFDPVHIAHEAIVREALETLNIDKLIIVPTYLNPFKHSFYLEPKTRYKLLQKVFDKFEKVFVCDYEINQKAPSYSINTINYLNQIYTPSKIYFIIGEDNLATLDSWHQIEELKKLVEFVVVSRKGFEMKNAKNFISLNVNINISSTLLRKKIDFDYIPKEIKDDILNLN